MRVDDITNMTKGWFIGDFEPSMLRTEDVEVAIKEYKKGDEEQAHYHKVATEITTIVSGRVEMFGRVWSAGDIIVAEPGDVTNFRALEDAVNVVVKVPSIVGDKFIVEERD